ncbi:PfkB family carbohydrate kinase, partial [Enterococcus faecalis]
MIAVVGSNMVDLITYVDRMPKPGETVEAPDFQMGCGGKGANQAVAAARMGADVLMVTRVGNDNFATHTKENFAANG